LPALSLPGIEVVFLVRLARPYPHGIAWRLSAIVARRVIDDRVRH
jgi:hypothetical protein